MPGQRDAFLGAHGAERLSQLRIAEQTGKERGPLPEFPEQQGQGKLLRLQIGQKRRIRIGKQMFGKTRPDDRGLGREGFGRQHRIRFVDGADQFFQRAAHLRTHDRPKAFAEFHDHVPVDRRHLGGHPVAVLPAEQRQKLYFFRVSGNTDAPREGGTAEFNLGSAQDGNRPPGIAQLSQQGGIKQIALKGLGTVDAAVMVGRTEDPEAKRLANPLGECRTEAPAGKAGSRSNQICRVTERRNSAVSAHFLSLQREEGI